VEPALRFEVEDLYASYAAVLDEGRFDQWPDFFTEECVYKIIPRENFDAGRGLATLAFESKNMLKDRVRGVVDTLFHAPYYQRHIVSSMRMSAQNNGEVRVRANFLVIRTKRDELSDILSVGRYQDCIVRVGDSLVFREKLCIFDSELIPNSLIYPI